MGSRKKVVEAPASTALVAMQSNQLVQNGLMAVNADVSNYMQSIRRRQLRTQREKCDAQLKAITKRKDEILKQIEIAAQSLAVASSMDWISKLNAAFSASDTPLVAEVTAGVIDYKSGNLKITREINKSDMNSDDRNYSYSRNTFTKGTIVPISGEIKSLNDKVEALDAVTSQVQEISVKIQRELHELPNLAQDAQAAIFSQAMHDSKDGKAFMSKLDAKLDEMPSIPDLPLLPSV